jgi:CBS domain-containing protein
MHVRDIMETQVYSASPTTTVKELLLLFKKNRIGGVPVVDFKGRLLGLVTDGDLLRFLASTKKSIPFLSQNAQAKQEETIQRKLITPIIRIMIRKKIKTVTPDTDFVTVLKLMSQQHIKKIPVVDELGYVVGVVSRGNIIQHLSKKTEQTSLITNV